MQLMRTTVNVSDHLLAEAKALAAASHRTLGELVDDALRAHLARHQQLRETRRVELPTDGGSGLQPGVDLEDREAMAELLGENLPLDASR